MEFEIALISDNLKSSFGHWNPFIWAYISPTYRGEPNYSAQFYKQMKIYLVKNFFMNYIFKIFGITIELYCNGKNLWFEIYQIFLDNFF